MNFKRCSEDSQHPLIVVEENRRKFTIRNPQRERIKKVRVDGCLIDDERQRCDYLFEVGQICNCVIYLELKGSDIDHAFNQLVATIGYLVNRHQQLKKICHIVASRVPRAGPKVQNLKVQMVQKYGARLFVDTQASNVNIDRDPYRNIEN
jgi:hypothetical protein